MLDPRDASGGFVSRRIAAAKLTPMKHTDVSSPLPKSYIRQLESRLDRLESSSRSNRTLLLKSLVEAERHDRLQRQQPSVADRYHTRAAKLAKTLAALADAFRVIDMAAGQSRWFSAKDRARLTNWLRLRQHWLSTVLSRQASACATMEKVYHRPPPKRHQWGQAVLSEVQSIVASRDAQSSRRSARDRHAYAALLCILAGVLPKTGLELNGLANLVRSRLGRSVAGRKRYAGYTRVLLNETRPIADGTFSVFFRREVAQEVRRWAHANAIACPVGRETPELDLTTREPSRRRSSARRG